MPPEPEPSRVPAAALSAFVAAVLERHRVPPADAERVAATMVEADLLGYETHGVFRLRQYVDRLAAGGTKAAARPRLAEETLATGVVDGDGGLGQLAMHLAVETAMAKAAVAGIGWVGVRNGNHAGPLALYVRPQTGRGMIGLAAAVGSANHVPPHGGQDLLLGTNPLAVAVPGGDAEPFLLDMATTVASAGKIKVLAQRGLAMPEGWMVGRDGRPLTDPKRQGEGLLLPIGGAKGYGLAVAIALLAGVLNGAAAGSEVVDFTAEPAVPTNTGQFVAALRIDAFGDPVAFAAAAARFLHELEASTPLPGHDRIRVPGRGREALRQERLVRGLPLHGNLRRELDAIADSHGTARLDRFT